MGYTDDLFSALDIQDELQTLYTSGTVFHAFLGEKLPEWHSAARLVRKIAENYKLPYYTLPPSYSICNEATVIFPESSTNVPSPQQNRSIQPDHRILSAVQNWNDGKAQEFKQRKVYDAAGFLAGKRQEAPEEALPLLFTTQRCPNCRVAKSLLDQAGIAYTVIDAEAQPELARQYGITQAPTLVYSGEAGTGKGRRRISHPALHRFKGGCRTCMIR